jgi:hypothetical protein
MKKTIIESLSNLGETEEEIVKTLIQKNIKGSPKVVSNCPIANYLMEELSSSLITTSLFKIRRFSPFEEVATPKHIQSFIKNFNSGKYKELIECGCILNTKLLKINSDSHSSSRAYKYFLQHLYLYQ